jgi:hypothetical protein
VAEHFPEVCQAEQELMERLLGLPVERTGHILGGCSACEYTVREPATPMDVLLADEASLAPAGGACACATVADTAALGTTGATPGSVRADLPTRPAHADAAPAAPGAGRPGHPQDRSTPRASARAAAGVAGSVAATDHGISTISTCACASRAAASAATFRGATQEQV